LVTVLQTPTLEITADTVFGCAPFQVAITLRDTTGGTVVLWDFGTGVRTEGIDRINYIYPRSGTFDVTATVTSPNGRVADTTWNDLIRVIAVPEADFTWTPQPLTIFEPEATFS